MRDDPLEREETRAVIRWRNIACNLPGLQDLWLLFGVPNAAKRSYKLAHSLKMDGMQKGVPDLVLPVGRRGYCSLFIEMKRRDGGKVSDSQREFIELLRAAGNLAHVCNGADRAIRLIEWYLAGVKTAKAEPEKPPPGLCYEL